MGDALPGVRLDPTATDAVRAAIKAETGDDIAGCPHRVFWSPYVARVLRAYPLYQKSQLAAVWPNASVRTWEGVLHIEAVINRMDRLAEERRRRKQEQER